MKHRKTIRQITHTTAIALYCSLLSGCTFTARTVLHSLPQYRSRITAPKPDHTINGTAWTNTVSASGVGVTVLHVEATNHYSIGYWHGKLLGKTAYENMEQVLKNADSLVSKFTLHLVPSVTREDLVNGALDEAWALMELYVPRKDIDEMEGLAAGMKEAGVNATNLLKIIHRIHALPDLGETSCSALVAGGKATKDGHVWQLRILDYGAGSGVEKNPLITVVHGLPDENTLVNIGWIGFVGLVSGLNEKGVCISEMGYRNPPGERLDASPMIFLLKQALRYGNSSAEAVAILHAAERNNSYAYWVGDPKGYMAGLLTSATTFEQYWVNKQEVVYDEKIPLPQYRDVIYAGHDSVKQGNIVAQLQGKLCLETLQDMAKQIAMDSNLQTVIFDLTTLDLWVANAKGKQRAADCPYVPFKHDDWHRK